MLSVKKWFLFISFLLIGGYSCRKEIVSEPDGGPCTYEILDFTARLDFFTESIAVFDGGKYTIHYIELAHSDCDSLELTALYRVYVKQITSGTCSPVFGTIRKVGSPLE